jgi:hypothetical protein
MSVELIVRQNIQKCSNPICTLCTRKNQNKRRKKMAEVKYGELASWDDGDVSGPSDFMNLVEGDNRVRIVTNPYQFVVHWVKDTSGQNRKIRCSVDNCPLCKQGVQSQTRWYLGVLDYKSGAPKILEIGSQIFRGIRGYVNDPDWSETIKKPWGQILAYDINISRGPKGTQPLYQVKPSPKMKDISEEETSLVEGFMNRVDISKFTQPPKPEEVAEKMGISLDKASSAGQQYAVGTKKVTKTKAGVKPAMDDDEFEFGDEELE